ncbi:MAG: peptidase domain-containing ABC transporter [Cyanobacteria bacterium P01_H01_bin.121]
MVTSLRPTQLQTEQLERALGRSLSTRDLEYCRQQAKLLQPKVGLCWRSTTATPGLYLVLAGRARVVDPRGNLIATLQPGDSFGSFTLLAANTTPPQTWQPYDVKASLDLTLCQLPKACCDRLLKHQPDLYDRWSEQAEQLNQALLVGPGQATTTQITAPVAAEANAQRQQTTQRPRRNHAVFPNPTQAVGHLWQKLSQRYPLVLQQSTSDCGAACLAMVARYWGKRFSINRLRDLANVDRNGASLKGLAAAAETLGFETRPVRASLDQLAQQDLPAIVHWQGNHYVVVYAITRRHVIIVDPGRGQVKLTHQQFTTDWTGYALLLRPTTTLRRAKNESTPFWQFIELAKPHTVVLLEVLLASIFIQIFGLVTPLFTQIILDRVVVQRSQLTLFAVGLGLLIFSLFRVAMTGLRQYLIDHTANKIDLALIAGFIRHTLQLPLGFFETRYVGDIVTRVQENRKIQQLLSGEGLTIILDLLTVVIYIGLMLKYSWKLGLLVLVVVPPFFILALVATPFLKRISRELFNAMAHESSYLIEILGGIQTVKSTAIEQTVRWQWEERFNKAIQKQFAAQLVSNRMQIVSHGIEAIATTGLLWFGAYLVIENQLSIGQLVAFNMLLGNVITPFQRLTLLWNQLQEVMIATERINDVLGYEPEEDLQTQNKQVLPELQGQIQFKQVTFRYHPESDTNTLENLNFEVQPGQMVAVVGRSGSGKSTLTKLLLGLYPATDGQILIDGHDLSSLSLKSLRQHIGVVDQETFLFGGTIRENIALGKPTATLEEVMEAAQNAGADEFIRKLPMGYESQVGEGGSTLSGGQRQRLAIARALLANPPLLIFDEATSHLDTISESHIQANLERSLKSRTTIVIAHRLSTIRQADQILVLDQGVLVEQGNHAELLAKRGHYFHLHQQQQALT